MKIFFLSMFILVTACQYHLHGAPAAVPEPELQAILAAAPETVPRSLPCGAVRNLRDLAALNPSLNSGMLFRSAALSPNRLGRRFARGINSSLDEKAAMRFTAPLHIRTVIDLRTPMESGATRPALLPEAVAYHNIPFAAYGTVDTAFGRRAFARIMEVLCHPENYPVLFFCQHGTDRTGSLAFILEGLLGIPAEMRRTDWALSYYSYPECFTMPYASAYGALESAFPDDRAFAEFIRKCGISPADAERFRAIMHPGAQ